MVGIAVLKKIFTVVLEMVVVCEIVFVVDAIVEEL